MQNASLACKLQCGHRSAMATPPVHSTACITGVTIALQAARLSQGRSSVTFAVVNKHQTSPIAVFYTTCSSITYACIMSCMFGPHGSVLNCRMAMLVYANGTSCCSELRQLLPGTETMPMASVSLRQTACTETIARWPSQTSKPASLGFEGKPEAAACTEKHGLIRSFLFASGLAGNLFLLAGVFELADNKVITTLPARFVLCISAQSGHQMQQ